MSLSVAVRSVAGTECPAGWWLTVLGGSGAATATTREPIRQAERSGDMAKKKVRRKRTTKKATAKKVAKKATRKRVSRKRKPASVEVNEHNSRREVIIRHKGERVRVLCDDDGIHIGSVVSE